MGGAIVHRGVRRAGCGVCTKYCPTGAINMW
ncbi:4Fe-4S binding protein [Candidatus Aquicultor secundus]|nr:hypothetical protein [Solirubrobacter sp.]